MLLKGIVRFGLVGAGNTLLTLALIALLMYLGADPLLANALGYLCGFLNSFYWNRRWTFRSSGKIPTQMVLFGLTFLVCYLLQAAMFLFLKDSLGIHAWIATVLSMGIYTVLFFLLSRYIAFGGNREPKKPN